MAKFLRSDRQRLEIREMKWVEALHPTAMKTLANYVGPTFKVRTPDGALDDRKCINTAQIVSNLTRTAVANVSIR
ncbi:hypothetical protein E2C01_061195 [Portunus trituberculatus]|uniref:Uncharacterized protein n=1 Tax=Portunus trituberculatus TaxID=210409 RepID=A0A5B7HBL6_PORTR|nr:hypothetical protein [Portunus trituberculatus]